MTHDELLAKLWILPVDITETQHGARAVQALRAVVELHKPYKSSEGYEFCPICTQTFEEWENPCPTIQAIEKELE